MREDLISLIVNTTTLRRLLPKKFATYARQLYQNRLKARVNALPPLTEDMFTEILSSDLGLQKGDVVFVHSSIDHLHLAFPFYRILPLLQQLVREDGTLLFP